MHGTHDAERSQGKQFIHNRYTYDVTDRWTDIIGF